MSQKSYETHVLPYFQEVFEWYRDGAYEEEVAKRLGLTRQTLFKYKNEYPEFADLVKKAKSQPDFEVENNLYRRATGYRYTEITRELVGGEMVVTKEVEKEMAPDTVAGIFWLKNRQPKRWRDVRDLKHSGEMKTEVVDLSRLSVEELENLARLDDTTEADDRATSKT